MRITERVYLVGSGTLGFEMTSPNDCNVYLIDGGSEYALIDAGDGFAPELIVEQMVNSGLNPSKLTKLLLTHFHGDHVGGAAYFQQTYGVQVYSSAEAKTWVETADYQKSSLDVAIEKGVYPANFKLDACRNVLGLLEGEDVQVGDVSLRVIDTPGHSRGHVSYLLNDGGASSLFSGDVIFPRGRIVLQNIWDCSIQDYADSIAKLQQFQVNRLYPGHGPFLLNRAADHIEMAQRYFEKLAVAPNL